MMSNVSAPGADVLAEVAAMVATSLFSTDLNRLDVGAKADEARLGEKLDQWIALKLTGKPDFDLVLGWGKRAADAWQQAFLGPLGSRKDATSADDLMGELLNVIAGQLKSQLSLDHAMGLPRVCGAVNPQHKGHGAAGQHVWLKASVGETTEVLYLAANPQDPQAAKAATQEKKP